MRLPKIVELLEIVFWKSTIHLMSFSRNLLAFYEPVIDSVFNDQTKKVLLRSAAVATSGLTIGFTMGMISALLR